MSNPSHSVVPQIPGFASFELLGRGGYSQVWKAFQVEAQRWVAVKVLQFDIVDERAVETFSRECASMGAVSYHPNIVTLFTAGVTVDGRPYLVMALFDRGTYSDRLRGGPIDVQESLRTGVKLAGALETAHQAEILHRDIKPGNIFISRFSEPALGDFGISTVSDPTRMERTGFTPNYAAPELFQRQSASVATDVYALGATMFAFLEGRRPYDTGPTGTTAATMAKVLNDAVPRVRRPGTPESVVEFVARMMSKNPADRPRSAAAVGAALQALQLELGFDRTEMVVEEFQEAHTEAFREELTQPETWSEDPSQTARSVTLSAPKATGDREMPDSSAEPVDSPDRSRKMAWLAVGVGVVSVVALLGYALLADLKGATPTTVPVTSGVDNNDLFAVPPRPTDVMVSSVDGNIEVVWSVDQSISGLQYDLTLIGGGVDDIWRVAEPRKSLPTDGLPTTPCFEVTSIRAGRMSAASDPACLESS